MKKVVITVLTIVVSIIFGGVVLATAGTTNTDSLNFRDSASTSSNIIAKLDKGTKVEILETQGEWYKISYNGKEGYVSKQYLNVDENEGTVTENNTNKTKLLGNTEIYILPLLNSMQIGSVNQGEEVSVISYNGLWSYIQTNTISGWVFSNKLESTNTKISQSQNENENKEEENIDNENVLEENVTEETNTINNENESEEENNKTTNTTTSSESKNTETESETKYPTTMYVKVDAVNVRSEANTTSSIVTSIGSGVPVTVKGKTGDWYQIEVSDGKGYVKAEFLSKNR